MARYKYFDKSQGLFLTVNLNDQLMPGSFGHTLNHLIDRLDLGAFDAAFHNDKKGAPAYSPATLYPYFASPGLATQALVRAGKTSPTAGTLCAIPPKIGWKIM
jgi:hypothetical protein